MMCQKMEKIIEAASDTFNRQAPLDSEHLHTNIEELALNLHGITALDVGLDKCKAINRCDQEDGQRPKRHAPVTYIQISETEDVSLGIFIIQPGKRIPLHDHPRMHGIIKCIHGQLKVTAFTKKTNKIVKLPDKWKKSSFIAEKMNKDEIFLTSSTNPVILTPESMPAILEPNNFNIHEIESVGGPAAFLDVLAPPYNSDPEKPENDQDLRDCHYFVDVGGTESEQSERWLMLSNPPTDFYCDTETYQGPCIVPAAVPNHSEI